MSGDGSWTGGMWVGILWIAFSWTGNRRYRDAALHLLPALARRIHDPRPTFDLGFLLFPSFVNGYLLLGDEEMRATALRGAHRMLSTWSEPAELLSTVYPERSARYSQKTRSSIIDVMMNLRLLWWAASELEDGSFANVADRHARQTADAFVRPDGSTFQAVDFDADTGEILHRGTIHGIADDSTWARGQAWAVHGFALAHAATGAKHFWDSAEMLSRFFHSNLPDDGRPPWDLAVSIRAGQPPDTSAAAIVAAAWLGMGEPWAPRAASLLAQLATTSLAVDDQMGILANSTAYRMQGRGVNTSSIWGDYFFLSAIDRLRSRSHPHEPGPSPAPSG